MKAISPILFLLFALSGVAAFAQQKMAPPNVAEDAVRKLERAWLDAYEKHDAAAMNAIVADDFTITFADGTIMTKPQIMESLKRPAGSNKFRTENVQSRSYGDNVVILIGLVVTEWKQNEQTMVDRSRYTDTYVKRNGKWQVVASHLSKVGK